MSRFANIAFAVSALSCGDATVPQSSRPLSPIAQQEARLAIVAHKLQALSASQACIGVDMRTLQGAVSLATAAAEQRFADLAQANRDPPTEVLAHLRKWSPVPQSDCPITDQDRYHVAYGPLRVVGEGLVEMVVLYGKGGFPDADVCVASIADGQWRVRGCEWFWQA